MMKKIFIFVFVIAVIAGGWFWYKNASGPSDYSVQQNLTAPIEIPDVGIVTLNEVTDVEKPIVALFYADWCTYCRRFMPEFGKIAKKYGDKYTFAVVNCDYTENEDFVRDFHIGGFPSLFIIDRKLNHDFTLNMASTSDSGVFKEELDKYIDFRKRMTGK